MIVPLTKLKLVTLGESPCAVRCFEPVTVGVPLPKGRVFEASALHLFDGSERPLPLQARALDRWPDGSIRWALLDFQASIAPGTPSECTLAVGPSRAIRPTDPIVCSSGRNGEIAVETGALAFAFRSGGPFPFEATSPSGIPLLDPARSRFRLVKRNGQDCRLEFRTALVEEAGELRTVVRVEGTVPRVDAGRHLVATLRMHFYAGSGAVRFDLTLVNPGRARHPGGIWTLGDPGSILIKELSLDLALPPSSASTEVLCSPEQGALLEQFGDPLELYQESSGGQNWRNHNHINRNGVVPFSMKGYRLRTPGQDSQGLRATPIISLRSCAHTLGFAMRHFWQNFPKAVSVGDKTLSVSLFPGEFPDLHEIQGGEQKTHTFVVAFGRDSTTDLPLEWCRTPLLAHADPDWYASTGAVPYLTPAANDPNTDYLRLVNEAIEGEDTFERKREAIDEYGWRNFGDIYADHEAVFHSGPEPLVSHYNNQYDAVAGFAFQFLRSGNARWWTLMEELARHVTDIDIYHTDRDKAAFNGGLFWHTYHYVDAALSTHRAYPQAPAVNGGGPANEHNYTTGLGLHYSLTGEHTSRDAVVGLAEWVLEMDDGAKTPFRWLARGNTGCASATASPIYHGPGRGAGNSINALLDAHRLTGGIHLLQKAEQLIRRCIHPADDIAARELLDPERRWSYTVFLRALGKYLEHKHEHRDMDRMYAYARASLLHYTQWMASNERPYLDKPDILEYPTETWPALDMKKSEVFMVASRHADGAERRRYLERARFFFEYSVHALQGFSTRTKARPLTLMLSHGFMWAWFEGSRQTTLDAGSNQPPDYGLPERFMSQKRHAIQRALAISVIGLAVALITILVLLLGRLGP